MPKIGCGHEGLEWERVKEIIEEVFEDTDIEILVCSLLYLQMELNHTNFLVFLSY